MTELPEIRVFKVGRRSREERNASIAPQLQFRSWVAGIKVASCHGTSPSFFKVNPLSVYSGARTRLLTCQL